MQSKINQASSLKPQNPSTFIAFALTFRIMVNTSMSLMSVAPSIVKDTMRSAPFFAVKQIALSSIEFDKLTREFYKLSEVVRFAVSGCLGTSIFYVLERFFYGNLKNNVELLPNICVRYMDGLSYITAYIIQIIPQHLLNAFLVYGKDTISTREKYMKTLIGCYST